MWEASYEALQVRMRSLLPEVTAWYAGYLPAVPQRPAVWVQLLKAKDERASARTTASEVTWQVVYVPPLIGDAPDGRAQLTASERIRSHFSALHQLKDNSGNVFNRVSVKGGTRGADTFVRITLAAELEDPTVQHDLIKKVSVHY
ncbi:hypothetical protein [Paenibacillus arenosi]|uniref:Uncharacterized protein n=1 Tax=Paenibacillus arenosi TaxID=2774142 RepID=A0ABR9B432_9BACL|nr:hypothetical protein [Paenibacillus arenosi]MBD8500738.1 hypothetical protein [Paenibacillus arenosi]